MNGPPKAARALTAFVVVGAVLWAVTGRPEGGTRRKAAPTAPASGKEIP